MIQMVEIKVGIAEGVDKFPRLQVKDLGDHHGQQGVGRNIERYPQKDVSTALVELAGKFVFEDIELEEQMARRESHFFEFANIPG